MLIVFAFQRFGMHTSTATVFLTQFDHHFPLLLEEAFHTATGRKRNKIEKKKSFSAWPSVLQTIVSLLPWEMTYSPAVAMSRFIAGIFYIPQGLAAVEPICRLPC